ncbi:MAG: hypothetical protein K0R65_922 [Crocinitomicaceae bacterium]|jgi:nicotinamide mononucleotide transporter|nr:hypothetical protein [Crocinitomicaceae bacterium]
MKDALDHLLIQLYETGPLEYIAFGCSILYLVFATRKSNLCWYFALAASLIFVYLYIGAKLYFDSVLQLFYAFMAVVGWISWRKGQRDEKPFQFYGWQKHVLLNIGSVIFALILGYLSDRFTDQAYPYVDALIFSFSIMATFLTTERVPSTWIYFIIIDLVAIPVYWNRELELTAVLSLIMAVMAVFAYASWRKLMHAHA